MSLNKSLLDKDAVVFSRDSYGAINPILDDDPEAKEAEEAWKGYAVAPAP
jgi:hypothetical protein